MMLCPYSSTQSLFPNSQYCSAGINHCCRCIGRYLHMEGHISHCPAVSRTTQETIICQCALGRRYGPGNSALYFHNSLFSFQVPYISCALTHPTHSNTISRIEQHTGSFHYWVLSPWLSTYYRHVCSHIHRCPPHNPYFTDWCKFGTRKLSHTLLRAVRDILYILKSDEIITRVTIGWLQSWYRGSCSTSSVSSSV